MAVTKTNFINYARCKRYVALDELKKDKLSKCISYEEYKKEEESSELNELLSEMYDDDITDQDNSELLVMLPYYKEIELLAGKKVFELFGGKTIYALDTKCQKSFTFDENGCRYLCYVDIYNENDEVNIIEVKATTSKKYLELNAGDEMFYKDDMGIYHLKEECFDEKKIKEQNSKINKLLDKYDPCGKYIYDVAVQRMIIEGNLKYDKFTSKKINYYLATLNHEYIFDGTYENAKPKYTNDIICLFDVTNITEYLQRKVLNDKLVINKYISLMDKSACNLGEYCEYKRKSKCKFTKICMSHIPKYNSSLSYMNNGFGFKDECGNIHKGLDLINEGYINMLDVPLSWIKNKNHIIEREALITHKPYIDKEKIKLALNNIKYPIYHLDFETFPCPLPRFKGEKCYTQSPFQFSLHIERYPGVCDKEKDHYEFLSTDMDKDERYDLVKKLCEYIKPDGTLFAQNVSFERSRLKELANTFKEYKNTLLKICDTAYDLLYVVKGNSKFYESMGYDKKSAKVVNFYDERLSGSYSIKKTLPVFSDLKYDDMDVKNGTEALVTYARFKHMDSVEFKSMYNALLEYCKQDTWAMVVILDKIRKIVNK